MFSAEEYSMVIDKFINKMVNISEFFGPEIESALKDVCCLLRIGKIEMKRSINMQFGKAKKIRVTELYNCGDADISRTIAIHESIDNGTCVDYIFSQIMGDDEWTQIEQEKIHTLENLIFTFGGRVRVLRLEEELKYTDTISGLHNLNYFMKNVGMVIQKGEIENYSACFFNIKRLSIINKQIGYEVGTEVMIKYIVGLQNKLSKNEWVCRVGGDNFVTLFFRENLPIVMDYLNGTEIETTHNTAYTISATQGYYMIEKNECSKPTDVMDKIGTALNVAKKTPGVSCIFYDDEIKKNELRMKEIEGIFPLALKQEEFLVYYQPKVRLRDYTLSGAEALCRWRSNGEMIQPYKFIPFLEKNMLICELDFYMLEHVCRDIRRWIDEGRNVVKISVNFSRVHLGNEELLERIMSIISKYEIPHEYIEIELTETTTEVNYGELKRIVNGLLRQGIGASVDDFGTGYSSLNLIREFPWSMIKIDRSFLPDGRGEGTQEKTMLKYITSMAHDLGLQCIVEGVETLEQVMLLKENNCQFAQGYYFDKPLPLEEFEMRLDGKKM